jgi:uncharacterized membrane protein YdbT with pleckstrin-like domain
MEFFNHSLKDYVKAGDKIVMSIRMDGHVAAVRACLSAIFTSVSLALLLSLIASRGTRITLPDGHRIWLEDPSVSLFPSIALGLGIGLLVGLLLWLHYKSRHFAVSNTAVYEVSGLIFKQAKIVGFSKITDCVLKKGIIDLMFGTASLGISTPGGTKMINGTSQPYEIIINNIASYKKVRDLIYKEVK